MHPPATTHIYTLSLHDALPISSQPPLPNPPSTSSSAGALPRSSRCSGRRKVPTSSCRPEPALLTVHCATCSPPGIRPCPPTMVSPPHSLPQPEPPPTVSGALVGTGGLAPSGLSKPCGALGYSVSCTSAPACFRRSTKALQEATGL